MNKKHNYTYKGKPITIKQIAELGNIPWYVAQHRLREGWNIDKIINTPVRKIRKRGVTFCQTATKEDCLNCTRSQCVYDTEVNSNEDR